MRRFDPVLLLQGALSVVVVAASVAVGMDLGFRLDEPKTEIRTIVHDGPPVCREIEALRQAERATVEKLAVAAAAVEEASSALPAVVATAVSDEIVKQAKALDDANREVVRLDLQLAADVVATDAAIGACAPEREQ